MSDCLTNHELYNKIFIDNYMIDSYSATVHYFGGSWGNIGKDVHELTGPRFKYGWQY